MDACNSIRGALTLVKHVLDMLYQTGPPRGIEILPHEIEIFCRLEAHVPAERQRIGDAVPQEDLISRDKPGDLVREQPARGA